MALYRLGDLALKVETLLSYYGRPGETDKTAEALAKLPIRSLRELAVNGKDVMAACQQKAGPWLKETLAYLEQAVVEGRLVNDKTALLNAAVAYLPGILD